VAKKHRAKFAAPRPPEQLRDRIRQALGDGRSQTALDLARTLFKQDRSPENLQLLQQATLDRARNLRSQGQTRDAVSLLNNALDMGDAAFLQQVAAELAHCGQAKQALDLLKNVAPNGQQTQILATAVDSALRQGMEGRKNLPDTLHPHFDAIQQAFTHLEAGRDDQARACVQDIGLSSPFLEWKLLLRGLLAYYGNDDARALENWSRLDHQRLPARLAAPFRFQIDEGFRNAQPPQSQVQLREVADKLQGPTLTAQLRKIRACMGVEDKLAEAFRLMNHLMPVVKQQAPALLPRLANVFHWEVIQNGKPDDLDRYRRTFGPTAEDPNLLRLEALALESHGLIADANQFWKRFDTEIVHNPAWGDRAQINKVRSLIWCHMGNNAADSTGRHLPEFLRGMIPAFAEQAELPADKCFETSLQFDPELLEAHEARFNHLRESKKLTEAIAVGQELIKRFPNHVVTLEELGDVYMAKQDYAQALGMLQQALQHNPLERRLRGKVAAAHVEFGRALAQDLKIEEARRHLTAALALDDSKRKYAVYCVFAACEYKGGDAQRGGELVEQAEKLGAEPADLAFLMAAEMTRVEVPTKVRSRFTKAFTAAIAQPPTGSATAALLQSAALLEQTKATYYGSKSHIQKIIRFAGKALKSTFSEPDLEAACDSLSTLQNTKVLRQFVHHGVANFPNNPAFRLAQAELSFANSMTAMYQFPGLLEHARRLIDPLPQGERKQKLSNRLKNLEELFKVEALKRFPFGSILDSMFDEEYDEEDDGPEFFF